MFTEFISCEGFCKRPEKFQHLLKFSQKQRPIIVQLFGANPADFKKALEKIREPLEKIAGIEGLQKHIDSVKSRFL